MREAIRLLGASGLVDARPHRSAIVARPDRGQLLAMFETLCELETLCAGFAAQSMTDPERISLEAIHASLARVVKEGETLRYYEINDDFHSAIYAASHNAHLEKLTTETRARIAPFSRAQFRTLGRLAKSYREHDDIVRAILRGSRTDAVAAMRAHIETVYNAYETHARGVGESERADAERRLNGRDKAAASALSALFLLYRPFTHHQQNLLLIGELNQDFTA